MNKIMKKTVTLLLCFILASIAIICIMHPLEVSASDTSGDIAIDDKNFPDQEFKAWIKGHLNGYGADDNVFTSTEIGTIKRLDMQIGSPKVKSTKGIEFFTAMTYFDCWDMGTLEEIDVTKNTNLETLICGNNRLNKLDTSGNASLRFLNCSGNELTKLDISANTSLNSLACDNNKLNALSVDSNSKLGILDCSNNNLTELNVGNNGDLNGLNCSNNDLAEIDLSKNSTLDTLNCSGNSLTKLDVTQNMMLQTIDCSDNHLTSLDLSKQGMMDTANIGSQKAGPIPIKKSDAGYSVDLNQIKTRLKDTGFDISKVVMTDSGSLNSTTGYVSYAAKPTAVTYKYDTGASEIFGDKIYLDVSVSVQEYFTVNFESNGGSAVNSAEVIANGKIEKPKDPTKAGYNFIGWYKNADLTSVWEFGTDTVSGDMTLYAKWERQPGASDKPGSPSDGVDTGDTVQLAIWLVLALAACGAAVLTYRQKIKK